MRLPPEDDPDGVDDARDVAEQREQDVEPELQADADLQEHAQGRQEDGQQDTEDVHGEDLPHCSVVMW